MEKLALVAAGGALGAVLRWQGAAWAGRVAGEGFYGTAFVNVTGSFVMGALAVLMLETAPGGWARWAPFALTGVLGAYTTFSAFSLDAALLYERGAVALALTYVLASVLGSIAGLFIGLWIARSVL